MEKGRVGNKRKSIKKTQKTVICDRCKADAVLVKTNGLHEVYKCTKCKRTTERWI